MYRLGLSLFIALLTLVALAEAGDEKPQQPEKLPLPKPELKQIVLTPTHTVATVEMKDGSIFLAEFRLADTLTIRTETLGPITLKVANVRFLDLEGPVQRVGTHAPEMFYGLVQTEEFNVKLGATGQKTLLRSAALKRLVFPDRPRSITLP